MIARHVNSARQVINFSEWPKDPVESVAALTAACADMQTGHMPPAEYRLLHPEARITPGDVRTFCDWARSENQKLLAAK